MLSPVPEHPEGSCPATGPRTSSASMGDISVLGLGQMGSALARSLVGAVHRVTVWNRSPAKAQRLVDLGADGVALGPKCLELGEGGGRGHRDGEQVEERTGRNGRHHPCLGEERRSQPRLGDRVAMPFGIEAFDVGVILIDRQDVADSWKRPRTQIVRGHSFADLSPSLSTRTQQTGEPRTVPIQD